jgi:Host cell surface-exposed lipoprotein
MNTPDPRIPDGDQIPQPAQRKPLRKRLWVRVTGVTLAGVVGLIIAANAGSHPAAVASTTPASPPATSAPAVPAPAASTPAAPPASTPPASSPAPAAPATTAPAAPATSAPAAPAGPTGSQQQALDSASSYLDLGTGFSRTGLIDQLSSPYGGKFSVADATWAADHSGADWNAQAVMSAKGYMNLGTGFSRAGLIDQLSSPYGGKFTLAQATYAVNQVGL